jgi:transcription termination factor Rho
LQHIAAAVAANHPEMHLIMLLIDERPEEVTDMRRTIKGEVVASSNDRDTGNHLRVAELVMHRAKRMAEQGQQVFVLLDSLTRLARAYNKASNTGRTMSGGIDVRALDIPKKLFGSARKFDEGGSLTVMGTCLIETGSKMDDVIFQEFKGTGNMELVLDRKLADRRVFPAMDILQSGTRKEERLLTAETLQRVTMLRRTLAQMKPTEAMEALIKQLGKAPSNQAFLDRIAIPAK